MSDGVVARPRRPRIPATEAPQVVLPPGAEFDGVVILDGPARVEGRIRGEVIAADTVWVGETGRIEGPVSAENLVVSGSVEGDVCVSGRVALEPTARMKGELTAQRLILAEGSFLEGACHLGRTESPPGT